MKLQTKNYTPVDTSIWLDVDIDSLFGGSKLVLPQNTKLPPFFHAKVLAAGPGCKQVKEGDTVLLNAMFITQMKVSGNPDAYFTTENKVVAVVMDADLSRNGLGSCEGATAGEKVVEFTGAKE